MVIIKDHNMYFLIKKKIITSGIIKSIMLFLCLFFIPEFVLAGVCNSVVLTKSSVPTGERLSLSISVTDAALLNILRDLSTKTGIKVYVDPYLSTERVTSDLHNVTVEELLKKILNHYNFAQVFSSQDTADSISSVSPEIKEVWIFSKDSKGSILQELSVKVDETQKEDIEDLKKDTVNSEITIRYNAFQRLAEIDSIDTDSDEDKGISFIRGQLNNPMPEVRITALQTIAYNIDSELALEAARSALNDPDSEVSAIAESILEELTQDESIQEGGE